MWLDATALLAANLKSLGELLDGYVIARHAQDLADVPGRDGIVSLAERPPGATGASAGAGVRVAVGKVEMVGRHGFG
jgi:hypothetical protein